MVAPPKRLLVQSPLKVKAPCQTHPVERVKVIEVGDASSSDPQQPPPSAAYPDTVQVSEVSVTIPLHPQTEQGFAVVVEVVVEDVVEVEVVVTQYL